MPSFGESLRHERESRRATVEEIAVATGIDLSYLEALERNDIGALPGRAFGMLYIRAYAEMLGFDPKPLIEEYERENPRSPGLDSPTPSPAEPGRVRAAIAAWKEERTARPPARIEPEEAAPADEPPGEELSSLPAEESAEIEPSRPPSLEAEAPTAATAPSPRSGRGLLVAGLLGAVLVIAAGAWIFLQTRDEEVVPEPVVSTRAPVVPSPQPPAPVPEPAPDPPPIAKPKPPPPRAAAPASKLEVVEAAVGRSRKVETSVDRFRTGELAWFSTRVLGGRSGERIRHVWIRDGKTVWSKDLAIGAADWRTQTSKRLTQPGAWTVEARDASGAALASASFVCVP